MTHSSIIPALPVPGPFSPTQSAGAGLPSHAGSMPVALTPDPRLPRLADSASFVAYMGHGWAVPDRTPPMVDGAEHAAGVHRRKLGAEFEGVALVIAAGRAPVRVNDNNYDFRPDSNFYWLTGCSREGAVLVMAPTAGGHDATVYMPQPAYPGERDFFANAAQGEMWVGAAPGMPEWSSALGVPVRPLAELDTALTKAAGALAAGPLDCETATRHQLGPSTVLLRMLAQLRMVKDNWEIAQLREAVGHTIEGFRSVIREIPDAIDGKGERWLQGTFDRHARTYGNGVGYATIVGSGRHAPTLHWVRCDGAVLPEEVLLLDMGVEMRSYYTADITRTFPASGTFSGVQRQVHDLVEKSHRAALAAAQAGKKFSDFHVASLEVIAQGLHDWGLLKVSVDEALSPEGQQHRRWIVCGVGHHLGLDVHDCAQSSYEAYQGGILAPGMVLAVEPGLYFHANDLMVPPELRGIGVRIEDDILITPAGAEVLSDALPLDASGLERWMRAALHPGSR
ncbi:aminopeptidase P family protein [Arthrobacter sp. UYEF3]|uniref:aminopeptidase P family protein n=1 Tax=Arthrobacter sp. UYEF3 TaxID=1756365 RepID=UPI0033912603